MSKEVTPRLVIQKYGGSVLTDEAAYARAARQVAKTVQEGNRVVAVVSARSGVTDRLLQRAKRVHHHPAPKAVDLLLATGELESAALLALSLGESGVPCSALNPWQLGLHTDGEHGGARITRINPLPLKARLHEEPAVIVPGFIGRGEEGGLTTLGRGGSDLTAVALADTLGADRCEFFKDVPGYFSADPNLLEGTVHRPVVTVEEALELSRFGCRFLQDRALLWARRNRCRVTLRALGEERATELTDDTLPEHPSVLAMTHCDGPGARGSGFSMVSLVGTGIHGGRDLSKGIRACLSANAIDSRVEDRSGLRLTLAVPKGHRLRAQQIIHDRFIMEGHTEDPEEDHRITEKGAVPCVLKH